MTSQEKDKTEEMPSAYLENYKQIVLEEGPKIYEKFVGKSPYADYSDQQLDQLPDEIQEDLTRSKEIDERVTEYWETYQNLYKAGVLRSIGYDGEHKETFLVFSRPFVEEKDPDQRNDLYYQLDQAMKFISGRKRSWQAVLFRSPGDDGNEAVNLMHCDDKKWKSPKNVFCQSWYQGYIMLNYTPGFFECSLCGAARKYYANAHEWLKATYSADARIHQKVLMALTSEESKIYFRAKNEDPNYVSGEPMLQKDQLAIQQQNCVKFDCCTSNIHQETEDLFGAALRDFKKVPKPDPETGAEGFELFDDAPPLIFWLLTEYFRRDNYAMMKREGIFRITSTDADVRELETHLSQGNYKALRDHPDPFVVANYFKRMLRELQQPLILFKQYPEYDKLRNPEWRDERKRLVEIKRLIDETRKERPLRHETLKLFVAFCRDIVYYEEYNAMTSYNLAVCICPNIFRPCRTKGDEMYNVGIFYQAFISMVIYFGYLFNGEELTLKRGGEEFDGVEGVRWMNHGTLGVHGVSELKKSTEAASQAVLSVLSDVLALNYVNMKKQEDPDIDDDIFAQLENANAVFAYQEEQESLRKMQTLHRGPESISKHKTIQLTTQQQQCGNYQDQLCLDRISANLAG